MNRRIVAAALALLAAALHAGTATAQRYDYGGGGHGLGEEGFFLFLEAGIANPRNTDNVVAAVGPNVVIPEWDDEFAGRFGGGYRFGGGTQITVSFWGFSAEQDAADTGSSFSLPIGPIGPPDTLGFDVTTEIEAQSADAMWGSSIEVNEALTVEWAGGLRYASFEETTTGTYETTSGPRVPHKSNEAAMIGARLAGRATYRRGAFSAGAGLGLALLDGEIEAESSLTSQPAGTALMLTDDSRSGSILDIDVRGTWHASNERVTVWIGWEQQVWDDIAADLARNLPDSDVISRDRDSVSFSWLKTGVGYRF